MAFLLAFLAIAATVAAAVLCLRKRQDMWAALFICLASGIFAVSVTVWGIAQLSQALG